MKGLCPTCRGRGLIHWHPHWDGGHDTCTRCAGAGKIEDTDMTDLHHPRTAGEAVHRDNADLFPAAQPAQGVMPLVWAKDKIYDEWWAGDYTIWPDANGFHLTFWSIIEGEPHGTLKEAQDAAWTHHVARVTSQLEDALGLLTKAGTALEPAAQDGAEVERLRVQLSEMSQRYTSACQIVDKACTERDALKADNERLREALTLAANRLHSCAIDYDAGSRKFIETGEWADEARAALRAHDQGGT